jgi:hypothetical protein
MHWTNLLNPIAYYIVALAAIGQHLIIQIASQHVDVTIVEADGVRGPSKLELVDKL